MTTVADLNIKVDVDGAAAAATELTVLGERVDEVGDEASGAATKFDALGASMTALKVVGLTAGLAGAAGGLGVLTSGAGGLVAALGGAGVAAGGIAAIGATMGVAAGQALKLKYGTESVGDAFKELMEKGPIQEAMRGLNAEFRKLGDGVERFLLEVIPAGIEVFQKFVSKVGPYMEDIATAISKEAFEWADIFGKALDKVLPHVADWMKELSDILQPFFKSLIPAAVPGMNGLLRVLAGLGKGLTAIVKAGTPLIKMVTTGLGKGFEVLGKQLARIVEAFGPGIRTLFKGLETIFKGIADGLVAMAPGFLKAFQGLAKGLKELRPAMKPLGEALGSLLAAIGPLLPVVGKVITILVKGLAPIIKTLAPLLGKVLLDAAKSMMPVFKDLVKAVGELFIAIKPLLPDIVDLVLIGFKMMNATLPIAISIIRLLIGVIHGIVRVVKPVIHAIVDFAKEVVKNIRRGIRQAGNWLEKFIGWFKELPGKIASAVAGAARWLWNTGKDIIRGLWDGVKNVWQSVVDWFRGIKDKVLGFVKSAGTWLVEAGKAVWNGFLDGMKDAWEGVKGWFEDRWNDVKSLPSKLLSIFSPSKYMRGVGQNVVKGIYLGLQDEGTNLSKAWSDTLGRLTPAKAQVSIAGVAGAVSGARGRGRRGDGDLHGTLRIVGTRDLHAIIDARVGKALDDGTDFRTRRGRVRAAARSEQERFD